MISAALYEAIFRSAPVGNYLLSPTPEAIILAVNDVFLRASGRRREDLVGVSLFVAFPSNPDDPFDTGEADLRASLARVLATGVPDVMPAQRYPIPVKLPDGSMGFEERYWSATSPPLFGDDGQVICISHTTTDVTDRVRLEMARNESEKRYRALVSATNDVVYRMSPDWTELNQLEGRGFLQDTVDPTRFWIDAYIPAEDQDRIHAAIERAIHNKSLFELEHRVRRADGSYGWVWSRAVPMLDAQGNIYEWIGAASDITARKEAEEKLRDADRRKDEFLAMLAHELRNPLAPIGAAAELLQMMKLDESRVQQTSRIISRQVRHMTGLIDDLLDVSRVRWGQIELDKVPVDLRQIVHDAVEQVSPLMRSRAQQLQLNLPLEGALVPGDRKRLVQVVANILNNAAKFTGEGGQITLGMQVESQHVRIDIADNGIGMSPQLTARAFDLFAQEQRSSDRSAGGLGLGLALVKRLVELHHGTVACASDGLGRGSRFTVCLPRLHEPARVDDPHAPAAHAAADTHGLRIMVVDDNVDAASMLAMLLKEGGHQVTVEHRPVPALERARQESPQVCLLDIGLPDMDGNELAQRLRAQPETEHAVLVAITGYGQQNDRELAASAGFDYHLVKPVDTEALGRILASSGA
ncbi:MAG: ATP-binding protein [Gammaproteobacteria bacterium]